MDNKFWEYWIEEFESNVDIEPRLNELGKLHWELVSICNLTNDQFDVIWHCVFKRQRDTPDPSTVPFY